MAPTDKFSLLLEKNMVLYGMTASDESGTQNPDGTRILNYIQWKTGFQTENLISGTLPYLSLMLTTLNFNL